MAKFVRYEYNNLSCYGIMEGDHVRRITNSPLNPWKSQMDRFPVSDIRLLPPCEPTKIVAVGLNYTDHAQELGMEIPEEPILFIKPNTTICGNGDAIIYPETAQRVDYEAELGIVMCRVARNVDVFDAQDYVLGYTCLNDVTARDLQKRDVQWTRAKSFNTFCPIGPA